MPQLAQGVHLLPPGCTEDFISFSPTLARRRGGLYLVPQLAQGVHLLPPGCTEDFIFLACTRSRARRSFTLSRLHSLDGEEVFISFSPQDARER